MTQPAALRNLLTAVAQGQISPDTAFDKLKNLNYQPVDDFAKIDNHRKLRTGFPEVIWGQDKTVEQLVKIFQAMEPENPVVMATRITPEKYEQLQESLPKLRYYEMARICSLQPNFVATEYPGNIAVLTAGTADLPVAE